MNVRGPVDGQPTPLAQAEHGGGTQAWCDGSFHGDDSRLEDSRKLWQMMLQDVRKLTEQTRQHLRDLEESQVIILDKIKRSEPFPLHPQQ